MTYNKIEKCFRDNNPSCVPEWLDPFLGEYQQRGENCFDNAIQH